MKRIRLNDKVLVLAGKNKGATGQVIDLDWVKNKVKVDKVNIIKKHTKPTQNNPEGGIIEKEAFINISNVSLVDKNNKPIKVGFKVVDDKKIRVNRKTGKAI